MSWHGLLTSPLTLFCIAFSVLTLGAVLAYAVLAPGQFLLIVKNLRRNRLRTTLTAAAIMFLVVMVTGITTVLVGLDRYTEETARDLKLSSRTATRCPAGCPPATPTTSTLPARPSSWTRAT
jgi:hypothetical protein